MQMHSTHKTCTLNIAFAADFIVMLSVDYSFTLYERESACVVGDTMHSFTYAKYVGGSITLMMTHRLRQAREIEKKWSCSVSAKSNENEKNTKTRIKFSRNE